MNKNEEKQIKRRNRVIELLKSHPGGMGVDEISREIAVSRVTLAKDLAVLIDRGDVVRRIFGSGKLHYHPDHAESIKGFSGERSDGKTD